MSPITVDQAFEQTADTREAYGLPPDATDDQLQERRVQAAEALVAGTAANDAYWNSRGQLEQLMARASGHGAVVRGADPEATPTALGTPTDPAALHPSVVDAEVVEEPPGTGADAEPSGTAAATTEAAAQTATTPAPSGTPAPMPDNPAEAVAKLRAQVEALGGSPEV